MDKLTQHLKPIYQRIAEHPEREDGLNTFAADIRRVIKAAGYKSPEEVWDLIMGAKKSGFDDGVSWEKHRRSLELLEGHDG
jgi:hypothetical protein